MISNLKIACASNKKFAVLLCALLKSIELNHCVKNKTVDVFIIDNNIGRKRKLKIVRSIDPKKVRISFLKVPLELKNNLNIFPNGSRFTHFYRLFLPEILPQDIDRVLYFDCDMLVLDDLDLLWQSKLKQYEIVAAVQDSWLRTVDFNYDSSKQAISNWQELGFNKGEAYFNSGMLLIDLVKWRRHNITQKVIGITAKHFEHVLFYDQYGLNVILKDKWKNLSPRFNTSSTQLDINIQDVTILHFIGNKPISYDYHHNCQDLFYQYLDQTQWSKQRGKKFISLPIWLDKILNKNNSISQFVNHAMYKINHLRNNW